MKRFLNALIGLWLGLLLVAGVTLTLQLSRAAAKTDPGQPEEVKAGLAYLKSQQQADGGITGFSGVSDPDTTARSVLAFILAKQPITDAVSTQDKTMLDYLASQAISFTHDITGSLFPGRVGLLTAAVSVAGENPADFGGMDLAGALESTFQPATGVYSTTAKQDFSSGQASDLSQAWAILGLRLAGREVPQAAIEYLLKSQSSDGSWGFGDPDTTALAVVALVDSERSEQGVAEGQAIQKAVQYFHATQADSGGWKPSWDTDPLNADSTGWILQALVSAGETPTDESWTKAGKNPVEALKGLLKPDGAIGGTYANTYSTAEAIIGLSGKRLEAVKSAEASQRAGLAVFPGDGSVYTACVSFSESQISSLELLQRSEAAVETATNPNQGTAVCKIGNKGCPANDCFCSMPEYWSFWQENAGAWAYAPKGSDQSQVVDGDVNAWSWGKGDPPVKITFQNICEGEAFVMPAPTQTSSPSTDTPEPTQAFTLAAPTNAPQTTSTPAASQAKLGTYVVYGSILVVLIALIAYLVRPRHH